MKNVNLVKKAFIFFGLWLGNVTPLWAAEVGRRDNSNLFVWIFLAFCALIVVAQLIPALMVLFGFAKGVKKEKAKAAPETADALVPRKGTHD